MNREEHKQLHELCEKALAITNEMTASKKKARLKAISFEELNEMLDFIRVANKYQMFDIEATVRERKYLEKLLKETEQ